MIIKNHGINNKVIIEEGCRIYNSEIQLFGNNNVLHIKKDCYLRNANLWISDESEVNIGQNTHLTGKIHMACLEKTNITIGDRCMFSNEIVMRTSDSHSILNKFGTRTNLAKNITIGNHVWVGQQVIILKGAEIGSDSVIGTRALITDKKFNPGSLIVGTPARVVDEQINWDHRLM